MDLLTGFVCLFNELSVCCELSFKLPCAVTCLQETNTHKKQVECIIGTFKTNWVQVLIFLQHFVNNIVHFLFLWLRQK